MKSAFTRMIAFCYGAFLLSGTVYFIILIMLFEPGRGIIVLSAGFMALSALIWTGYVLAIRRRMTTILHQLSLTIQSLIELEERELFPVTEDTMLSKLQSQIVNLSRVLKSQRRRYQEEGDEMKALISDISHQLKTPLANLNLYNSLLLDESLDDGKRKQFTLHMQNQLEKMTWLMNSLIKMSRLEAGMIEIRKESASLADTVLSAIKQAYPGAESKGMEIRFQCEQPVVIRHDVKWTGEAVYNVIDNAVKYSPPGAIIEVGIDVYEFFARVDVRDYGEGITEDEINRLFQRFYRGDNARNVEGAGIGLYLTRKMITGQGGYIKVTSTPGKGSRFSVFLPV